MVSNSYQAADGAGEFLASVDLFGTWILGESVDVGGVIFDADWLIEPIVSFELEPVVTAAPTCLTETAMVEFSADSPFLGSRFFNQAAFLDLIDESYVWDFGDGSPTANGAVQSHEYIFAEGSVFQSALSATLFGWTASCVAEVSIPISTSSSCSFIFSDRFE